MYLSHFTPSMMSPETLESMLVQRTPLLNRCLDNIVQSLQTGGSHHTLFVGPRGIGKTHLISLIHHRLSGMKIVQDKALIAWMREEEWGVTSFFELVLRILRTLDASYPEFGIEERTQHIYELPIKAAETQAQSLLLELLDKKRLVVLLENLDDLFEQLGDSGQKAWRAFMQNHNNMVLVCTTPSLFSGVSLQRSAFYGFFDIEPLAELGFEDVVLLLAKIATERGDKNLAEFINTSEGKARIRAVHHLAEGNPRIYIIFAQFLSREALDDLVQAFLHTLDELTPYYQARMKELPGQQRKIIEYLVNYRGAAPVKQIAAACFITQQTCSSQLKVLKEKRYVRSIEQGRQSYYELCEPLMRLCMEVKKQRGEPVSLFVEMLRIWYTEDQLQALLNDPGQNFGLNAAYLKRALELLKTQAIEPKVSAVLKDLRLGLEPSNRQQLLSEFAGLSIKNPELRRIQSLVRLTMSATHPLATLDDKSLLPLVADVIEFGQDFLTTEKKEKEVFPFMLSLLSASLTAFTFKPEYSQKILEVIRPAITKFPAAAAVAIIRAMSLHPSRAADWVQDILVSLSKVEKPRQTNFLAKRLSRILKALIASRGAEGNTALLSLPKEERSLLAGFQNLEPKPALQRDN